MLKKAGGKAMLVCDVDLESLVSRFMMMEPPILAPSEPGQISYFLSADQSGYRVGMTLDLKKVMRLGW